MFISIAGNFINCEEIEFILNYSTKFAKDYYQFKKEEGKLANLTKNKETKSLIQLKSGLLLASAINPGTIVKKFGGIKPRKYDTGTNVGVPYIDDYEGVDYDEDYSED